MPHLSAGQKRKQKELRRKKRHPLNKGPTSSKKEDDFLLNLGPLTGTGCKLSAIIWELARPFLDTSSWDEEAIDNTVSLVILCWNIGTLPEHEREKAQNSLIRTLFTEDPNFSLETMGLIKHLVRTRHAEYVNDRRFIEDFSLTYVPAEKYCHLQVLSSVAPPVAFLSGLSERKHLGT